MGVADGDNLCALFACVAHYHQGNAPMVFLDCEYHDGLLVHDRVACAEASCAKLSSVSAAPFVARAPQPLHVWRYLAGHTIILSMGNARSSMFSSSRVRLPFSSRRP